jgi:hypothetical protein
MNKGEIITYRGKKYKIDRITTQKIKYPSGVRITKRAYLSAYGWDGENRVGIIRKGRIDQLEKVQSWGSLTSFHYKSW